MDNFTPLSERYRLLAVEWCEKESDAQLLEELKTPTLAQLQTQHGDIPVNRAEQLVKASNEWHEYIKKMVQARREANLAKVKMKEAEMQFSEWQSQEATRRAEMRL